MEKEITKIISRVLAGESSVDEEFRLVDWLGENSENQKYFADSERLWNALDIIFNRRRIDEVAAFGKFKSFTRQPIKRKAAKSATFKARLRNSIRWAAIGIILIGLGSIATFLVIDQISSMKNKSFEVMVPTGSRGNITLADGTSVWLNAGSRLTCSPNFGSSDRIVELEGEGFFEVISNDRRPFTVKTSQLEIIATGTSFNVKSYPDEGIIQTTLVSGSLTINRSMFKNEEKGVTLEPNQQITYYKDSRELFLTREKDVKTEEKAVMEDKVRKSPKEDPPRIILRRGIDPELFTSWKDNRLIFDNESFENIAVKLERRFGARIIIKDQEIKNKKFKGRFDEITIEQALSALKFASPFEYHIKQDTIYITKK